LRDARREDRFDQAEAWQRRDLFCRSDAAARTGYEAREAARDEQARGSIGGTLGGAALGAIIGGAAGNAGTGAAIGAGAGLLAGSAVGADNARRAAADVEAEYGDAYHACMDTAQDDDGRGYDDRGRYAAGYLPPPVYARPYPGPYYYPYPRAYGPSFGFSFGLGPSYRGFYGPPRRYYGRPGRPWRR
jgi:outer membrane lipoprotein SlyB